MVGITRSKVIFLFPNNLPGSDFLQEVFATGFAFAALKKDGSVVTWGATRALALGTEGIWSGGEAGGHGFAQL